MVAKLLSPNPAISLVASPEGGYSFLTSNTGVAPGLGILPYGLGWCPRSWATDSACLNSPCDCLPEVRGPTMHMLPTDGKIHLFNRVSTEHEWESELVLNLDTAQVTFST